MSAITSRPNQLSRCRDFGRKVLNQTSYSRRQLRANASPVLHAIKRDAQTLFVCISHGVIKPYALNETTIAAITGIGRNEVVKRTFLGAATG
jgi:hypothetical protein